MSDLRGRLRGLVHDLAEGERSRLNPRYVYGRLNDWGRRVVDARVWESRLLRQVAGALCVVLAVLIVIVPFDLTEQLLFSAVFLVVSLYLRRFVGTLVTLLLIGLSMLASTRYLYWRFTETLAVESSLDLFLGTGLLLAEVYAWLVLMIGFVQTIWPLRRKPVPMPDDVSTWPSVAILIPSYNEPLSVVRPTVMAALAQDWPRDRLKVYILDDGRREEFREFAELVGVTHITRDNNRHAKAGNINQALPKTEGELVAIFDCDHIPNRSFLQMTVGQFLVDPKLAMVQTPHHFLSPDPFERNLGVFRAMPNEGALFYGLVQDGNDLWNATFFCGSCAILRRDMLLEVGGIAVETVTEDAHTALKLHRRGYNTAYIGITQAAGLATESLSAHVGQRIRWARGMAQIFRIDNPLLGPGLNLAQRLCYINAMLHFFYGLPRLVFLTSPLAYFFFEAHIIAAPSVLIAAYALPHLIHANIANSRMQGKHRHSFWAEVYETALAWYIFVPTTLAVINPKLGTFNVTAKGGVVERDYFDWKIATPYVALLALNLIGLIVGLGRLFIWNTHEAGTVILNLLWTLYNLMMLGATLGVAFETRQIRRSWRVRSRLPAMVQLPNGRTIACETEDYSEGGVALALGREMALPLGTEVTLTLYRGDRAYPFPVKVVYSKGEALRLQFHELSLDDYRALVAATFSRGDAWQEWLPQEETDRPLRGLAEIFKFSIEGMRRFVESALLAWRLRQARTRFKELM